MATEAFSARGLARAWGFSKDFICLEIQEGRLHASRVRNRRYVILRKDAEAWLEKDAVMPRAEAEARVREILDLGPSR